MTFLILQKLEAGKLSFTEETIDLYELVMKIKGGMLLFAHKKGIELKFDYLENIPSSVNGKLFEKRS